MDNFFLTDGFLNGSETALTTVSMYGRQQKFFSNKRLFSFGRWTEDGLAGGVFGDVPATGASHSLFSQPANMQKKQRLETNDESGNEK